jgi:hypothetical protein
VKILMKIRWLKPKNPDQLGSNLLILAAMGLLVAFAGTFGARWALLAAGFVLIVLGMAVGA